ncbi:hypothetical protein QPK87_20005 [Kamptonema cortianum]|nr:hypothetical protein [Geitlerinema splendidum]MDK3158843.1 hypothetical protein [Kamptonema cortianum]
MIVDRANQIVMAGSAEQDSDRFDLINPICAQRGGASLAMSAELGDVALRMDVSGILAIQERKDKWH